MNIGYLDDDLSGHVAMLAPQFAANIVLEKSENVESDKSPSHRVLARVKGTTSEIGAAWLRKDDNGREYFSMSIDQPGFDKPVSCAAFRRKDEGWDVSWNRPKSRG